MSLSKNTAKHFRDVYFGGNWTVSNVKDQLRNVTWEEATIKVSDEFNTILELTYHMIYFVRVVNEVLEGKPLSGSDKFSFDHPSINSQKEWEDFLNETWKDALHFVDLIEKMPDELFWKDFSDKKYGNYYRNINGIIEHCHYHLGQIVMIKKLIAKKNTFSLNLN